MKKSDGTVKVLSAKNCTVDPPDRAMKQSLQKERQIEKERLNFEQTRTHMSEGANGLDICDTTDPPTLQFGSLEGTRDPVAGKPTSSVYYTVPLLEHGQQCCSKQS